ncbi:hypothetical protein UCREL1_11530 [Eutypa lata UCREL1]|uniref:Uncharacterized protein n=1 Tax=Eutypa lata (strain UCR-EL1) TaxID=1287681 RepID=M7SVD2_EUTLA|nr:hypothetical protein UCREL1_11530 [Eutypa lata UCREL1]
MTLFNSASSSASSSSEEEGRDDNEDDIPVRAAVSDIEPDLDLDLELPRLLLLLLLVLAVATDSTDPRRWGGNAAHADTGTAGKFGIAMHMLSGLGIGMRAAENGIAMLSERSKGGARARKKRRRLRRLVADLQQCAHGVAVPSDLRPQRRELCAYSV